MGIIQERICETEKDQNKLCNIMKKEKKRLKNINTVSGTSETI